VLGRERRLPHFSSPCVAELALRALRAEEHDLRRFVAGQVGRPVLGVHRHPRPLVLGALEDGCGTFSPHSRQEVRGPGTISTGRLDSPDRQRGEHVFKLRPRLLLGLGALAFGLWYGVVRLWALVLRRMAQSVSSWEELEDAPPSRRSQPNQHRAVTRR
jgi:hypothetical protein